MTYSEKYLLVIPLNRYFRYFKSIKPLIVSKEITCRIWHIPLSWLVSSGGVLQSALVLVVTTSNQYHTGLLTPDCPGPGPASCEWWNTGGKSGCPMWESSTGGDSCLWWWYGVGGSGRQRPAASVAAFFLRPTSDHRLLIHCSVT